MNMYYSLKQLHCSIWATYKYSDCCIHFISYTAVKNSKNTLQSNILILIFFLFSNTHQYYIFSAVLYWIILFRYFKPSYIHLSASYGIHHRWIQNTSPTSWNRQSLWGVSQEWCMAHRRCRSHARGDDVRINIPSDLNFIVNVTYLVACGLLSAHNTPTSYP